MCVEFVARATPFLTTDADIRPPQGREQMHKLTMVALGAVAMSLAMPAAAQDMPFKDGDYWTVSR